MKFFVAMLMIIISLLVSCAPVPKSTIVDGVEKAESSIEQEIKITTENALFDKENFMKFLPEHISEVFETESTKYIIEAQPKITNDKIYSGSICPFEPKLNLISSVCFGDKDKYMVQNPQYPTSYDLPDIDNLIDGYDNYASFAVSNGRFFYTNIYLNLQYVDQIVTEEIQAPNCKISREDAIEQCNQFLSKMEFSNFAVKKISSQVCKNGNKKGYYQIIYSFTFDNIEFAQKNGIGDPDSIGCTFSIGDEGIIDVRGYFFVDLVKSDECNQLLNFPDIMKTLEMQINNYSKMLPFTTDVIEIKSITMEYLTKSISENNIEFKPVWRFVGSGNNLPASLKDLIIDAQTGELIYF